MKLILSIIALTISLGNFAQSGFTGTVTYSISATGPEAEQMAAFMPTSQVLTFGTEKMRFEMVGGMSSMMGHFIFKDDQLYQVQDWEKTAYIFPAAEEAEEDMSVIVKTNETKVILGHTCTKYTITTTTDEGSMTTIMWVASDLKPSVKLSNGNGSGGLINSKIDGLTLMTESETMGVKMTTRASDIDDSTPDASLFEFPSSYEIEEFDAAAMFGN